MCLGVVVLATAQNHSLIHVWVFDMMPKRLRCDIINRWALYDGATNQLHVSGGCVAMLAHWLCALKACEEIHQTTVAHPIEIIQRESVYSVYIALNSVTCVGCVEIHMSDSDKDCFACCG